jgi:hypothetical protein
VQASDPAQPPTTLSFKPAQPVLNRFQMELTGTNIRFYEEDGSVYLGAMQITNASPTLDGASASLPASRTILRDAAAYSFSVQGTNQTLGSELILTGQFFAQTNLQPSPLDSFAIAPEVKSAEPPQPSHLIIGTAVVGTTNQIPVRAISNQP